VANPRRHFFVCTNHRPPGSPKSSCGHNGSEDVLFALREEREKRGLSADIFITGSGCLGPCPMQGASVVVYPEGVWYTGVTVAEVQQIVEQHMIDGEPVDHLRDPYYRNQ
jgi:(2Fe-2S) ferredoxin